MNAITQFILYTVDWTIFAARKTSNATLGYWIPRNKSWNFKGDYFHGPLSMRTDAMGQKTISLLKADTVPTIYCSN